MSTINPINNPLPGQLLLPIDTPQTPPVFVGPSTPLTAKPGFGIGFSPPEQAQLDTTVNNLIDKTANLYSQVGSNLLAPIAGPRTVSTIATGAVTGEINNTLQPISQISDDATHAVFSGLMNSVGGNIERMMLIWNGLSEQQKQGVIEDCRQHPESSALCGLFFDNPAPQPPQPGGGGVISPILPGDPPRPPGLIYDPPIFRGPAPGVPQPVRPPDNVYDPVTGQPVQVVPLIDPSVNTVLTAFGEFKPNAATPSTSNVLIKVMQEDGSFVWVPNDPKYGLSDSEVLNGWFVLQSAHTTESHGYAVDPVLWKIPDSKPFYVFWQDSSLVNPGHPTPPHPPITPPTPPPPTHPPTTPTPTPPTPPPGCPTPPACPPTPPPVKCDPPTTPPKKYTGWKGQEGACYIADDEAPPKDPADTKIVNGEITPTWVQAYFAGCCDSATSGGDGGPPQITVVSDTECSILPTAEFFASNTDKDWALASLNLVDDTGKLTVPESLKSLNIGPFKVGSVIAGVISALVSPIEYVVRELSDGMGCTSPRHIKLTLSAWIVGFFQRWTGNGLHKISESIDLNANYECQTGLMSADNAVECWYSDTISEADRDCIIRANNQPLDTYQHLIDARQTRFNVAELITLWRREIIVDSDYQAGLRALGYVYGYEDQYFNEITKQIPAVSDIIRFMVRDVFDTNVVSTFNLDDQFDNKYAGRLKDWGKYQGIEEDHIRAEWRAHWNIPSPTQLFEMYHRLRNLDPSDSAYTDETTIKTALSQDDVLPFWIDRFLAISFRPLTRVDVRRAYELGTLDEDDVKRSYLDLGYNDENANRLKEFAIRAKRIKYRSHKVVGLYRDNQIGRTEMEDWLVRDGADKQAIIEVTDWADMQRDAKKTAACLKRLRQRAITGDITVVDAQTSIAALGLDQLQLQNLTDTWTCEFKHADKAISIGLLYGMFERGSIDIVEVFRRLKNLGYDDASANLIVTDFRTRLYLKQKAEDQKRMQQLAREAKQTQKAAMATQKALQGATQKQQQAIQKAQAVKAKRQDQVLAGAQKVAAATGQPLGDTVRKIGALINSAQQTGVAPTHTLYEAVVTACIGQKYQTWAEFEKCWKDTLSQVESLTGLQPSSSFSGTVTFSGDMAPVVNN